MRDLNDLYGKLAYMKKTYPSRYEVFVASEGQCSGCGTTFDVEVLDLGKGLQVCCSSCQRVFGECKRLRMDPSEYLSERSNMIKEILHRLEGKIHGENEDLRDRNIEIYNLYLLGRPHAHIADMYGISRERVRQILRRIRSKN